MISKLETLTIILRLLVIKGLLNLVSVKTIVAFIRQHARIFSLLNGSPLSIAQSSRLARKTEHWARTLPFDLACLPQSLTLAWLLFQRGQSVTVYIGVAEKSGFESHAWIDADGITYGKSGQTLSLFKDIWNIRF